MTKCQAQFFKFILLFFQYITILKFYLSRIMVYQVKGVTMAIMNKMRENTHIILFILLVGFLLSMTIGGLVGGANIMDIISGRKPDTILKVNGENISYDQFSRAYQMELEQYRQQNGQEPSAYQIQQIEEQVWESFIRDILKRQEIEKLKIDVPREEIRYYIYDNPHPIYTTDQNFFNEDNQFDPERFRAALSTPGNDAFWNYKENYLRLMLPYEKLDYEILSTIRVTDEELKEEFRKKNQNARVDYLFFDINKFNVSNDEVSDKQITAYYNDHQDEFKESGRRKIQYVLFSIDPSASDSTETIDFANMLLDSLRLGSSFESMAKAYSDDPGSAEKGGDLGFFARGSMVKPFEDAAFSGKIGDIIGPVKSNFGLHIIKVEDKKIEGDEEQVKARHILLKYKPSRGTQESARENANYFAEVALDEGFLNSARIEKIKIDTTDYFTDSGFIPSLGMQKRLAMNVFNQKVGDVSKVYYIEDKGHLVYEVLEIQKEKIKPLDSVRETIVNILKRDLKFEKAKLVAQNVREKIQVPEDLERIASEDSLQFNTTAPFTSEGNITGVGRDPVFAGVAFALDEQEISQPVKGTRGYYIIRLLEKSPFDETGFNAQRDQLQTQLLDTKRRTVYTTWLNTLKENAKIKDYRYVFY